MGQDSSVAILLVIDRDTLFLSSHDTVRQSCSISKTRSSFTVVPIQRKSHIALGNNTCKELLASSKFNSTDQPGGEEGKKGTRVRPLNSTVLSFDSDNALFSSTLRGTAHNPLMQKEFAVLSLLRVGGLDSESEANTQACVHSMRVLVGLDCESIFPP